jgi:hypothetical protein
MNANRRRLLATAAAGLTFTRAPRAQGELPIFDAHLH